MTDAMTLLPAIKRCRYCHAEIRWVTTGSGRRMPIDPWPTADGDVQLVGEHVLHAEVLRTGRAVEARARGLELFRSHIATCPHHK